MPLRLHTMSTRQRSIICVEITFEEDRQGGVLNGPRAYFHDPDGTVLEFIDLTSYAGSHSCIRPVQAPANGDPRSTTQLSGAVLRPSRRVRLSRGFDIGGRGERTSRTLPR